MPGSSHMPPCHAHPPISPLPPLSFSHAAGQRKSQKGERNRACGPDIVTSGSRKLPRQTSRSVRLRHTEPDPPHRFRGRLIALVMCVPRLVANGGPTGVVDHVVGWTWRATGGPQAARRILSPCDLRHGGQQGDSHQLGRRGNPQGEADAHPAHDLRLADECLHKTPRPREANCRVQTRRPTRHSPADPSRNETLSTQLAQHVLSGEQRRGLKSRLHADFHQSILHMSACRAAGNAHSVRDFPIALPEGYPF